MRREGTSEAEIATFESTFPSNKRSPLSITTYRPRCNRPIAPAALIRDDAAL